MFVAGIHRAVLLSLTKSCATALVGTSVMLYLAACGESSNEPPPPEDCLSQGVGLDGQLVCYTAETVEGFRAKKALNPLSFDGNPYADDALLPDWSAEQVCALRYEEDQVHYQLRSFADEAAARAEGYTVTHGGGCGTCSTLVDLAAYLEHADLTTPVRECSMSIGSADVVIECLTNLGFTEFCAQTWLYNALNTFHSCFDLCLDAMVSDLPNNLPDGSLNPCLACDEEQSGPIFKWVAGRTRRNSGIRSAIDRPDRQVYPITHDYY
jgi:hypothetical protein